MPTVVDGVGQMAWILERRRLPMCVQHRADQAFAEIQMCDGQGIVEFGTSLLIDGIGSKVRAMEK